jgi:hypothetical protein
MAIKKVFEAIHEGDADSKLLSYQYLQMLPKLAEGEANKVWIVPSELGKAVEGIGGAFTKINLPGQGGGSDGDRQAAPAADTSGDAPRPSVPRPAPAPNTPAASTGTSTHDSVADRPTHTPPRPRRLSPADVLYGAEDE